MSPTIPHKSPIINLEELIQTMHGNKHLVKECFDTFCETHEQILAQIKTCMDGQDWPAMVSGLAGFRDSVKHLSCKPIMDAAFNLERAASAGNTPLIGKEFTALYDACDHLQNFIVSYPVKNLFMKFLIVDTGFGSRKKSQQLLSRYGECDVALNGLEALNAFVRAHNEEDPYHLIFLDIEMEGLECPQVLEKIRQWERSKAIFQDRSVKIILLSTGVPPDSVIAHLEPGHETWMVKPVTRDRLAKAFPQIRYK